MSIKKQQQEGEAWSLPVKSKVNLKFRWKTLALEIDVFLADFEFMDKNLLFIDKFAFWDAVILPERTICKNVIIFIKNARLMFFVIRARIFHSIEQNALFRVCPVWAIEQMVGKKGKDWKRGRMKKNGVWVLGLQETTNILSLLICEKNFYFSKIKWGCFPQLKNLHYWMIDDHNR